MTTQTVIQGDCLEVMKTFPDKSFDLVLTDPPYNISKKKGNLNDSRNGTKREITMDFGEWDYGYNPIPFLEETKRVLRDDGGIIVWSSEELYGIYRKWFGENMYPRQLLVWVKSNPLPQFLLAGYRNSTEIAHWATKEKGIKKSPNFLFQGQLEMTNVFHAPIVGGKEREKHPTQKPLSIFKKLIATHCREYGNILDPFLGSGTTLVAAKQLNRNAVGIEISPEYCEIARQRLNQNILL